MGAGFVAALPVLSAALFVMPGEDPFAADDHILMRVHDRAGIRSFVCMVVAAVMIAATSGFAKGLATASLDVPSFAHIEATAIFLIFCGAAVICFLANCGNVIGVTRGVYAVLIFYGVLIAVASGVGFPLIYIEVGKELLWMLLTCLMAYMVFRFDLSPVRAFGLGQAAYLVASALSWWFGMLLAPVFSVCRQQRPSCAHSAS